MSSAERTRLLVVLAIGVLLTVAALSSGVAAGPAGSGSEGKLSRQELLEHARMHEPQMDRFLAPTKMCPPGQRRDMYGNCRILIETNDH